MERKNKGYIGLIVLVVILLFICVGLGCFILINKDKLSVKENTSVSEKSASKKKDKCPVCEKCTDEEKKNKCSYNLTDLYATYYGEKEHPNDNKYIHRVELTLKENNEAVLHQSDGLEADYTRGKYICEYDRIIYTPLYYDYEGNKNSEYKGDIQNTFIVYNGELKYFYGSMFPINLTKK